MDRLYSISVKVYGQNDDEFHPYIGLGTKEKINFAQAILKNNTAVKAIKIYEWNKTESDVWFRE